MLPSAPLLPMAHGAAADLPGQLLAVVAELTDVIVEENAVMAEGLPAAVADTIDRKLDLSEAYEELYAELADTRPEWLTADPDFAARLMEAVLLLRQVTAENLTRLEAAVNASRRRVEAVMTAMRSVASENAPYGAKGSVPLDARLAAFGRDFHA